MDLDLDSHEVQPQYQYHVDIVPRHLNMNMRQNIIIKWKWKSVYTSFRFRLWWIKQLIFFKLNTTLYEALPSCKFHQFICFCILNISQQYAFTTLGLEGLSLVHRNYVPRFVTKNSQV